ncbi:hypothetical protein ACFSCX_17930 [Bacillus salitolerans]|uniref:DUF4367 domain-containing protein n=1 Tax=Bacillus salitolerans TaxID=1437434 RepID=A0ABW4LTH5_9BACI
MKIRLMLLIALSSMLFGCSLTTEKFEFSFQNVKESYPEIIEKIEKLERERIAHVKFPTNIPFEAKDIYFTADDVVQEGIIDIMSFRIYGEDEILHVTTEKSTFEGNIYEEVKLKNGITASLLEDDDRLILRWIDKEKEVSYGIMLMPKAEKEFKYKKRDILMIANSLVNIRDNDAS